MTVGECGAMLAIAGKVFGKSIMPAVVETWAEFMGDIEADEGARAMRSHIAESNFFPTVADIRKRVAEERIGGPVDPGLAWGEVRRAISRVGRYGSPHFESDAVAAAVEALGWVEICNSKDDDLPTLRAHFDRYYRAAMSKQATAANVGALDGHRRLRLLKGEP